MKTFCLPVPEIQEETVFQHSFTQQNNHDDSMRLRPPRLKPHNRSVSLITVGANSGAQGISFDKNGVLVHSNVALSASYDKTADGTYFEQCFMCLQKLGEGSFGEVFKVQSKDSGRLYAVKVSKNQFRGDQSRSVSLEEVRRYQQFSGHKNCLRFYAAWEENDCLYMQLELCRETLEHYVKARAPCPLAEDKIWSILIDLLLAVKSLHDKNLIHLDIKLDNVLIGQDGSCKLADFGLVVDVDKANREQVTEGDSRYIAPEILDGKFSKAADIFSLGVAILELSCYLQLPSNGPLWQQLRNGGLPREFMEDISPELQRIIRDMMHPDPAIRPTVEELLNSEKIKAYLKKRKSYNFYRMKRGFTRLNAGFRLIASIVDFIKFLLVKWFTPQPMIKIEQCDKTQSGDILRIDCTPQSKPIRSSSFYRSNSETPVSNFLNPFTDGFDVNISQNGFHQAQESTPIVGHIFRSRKIIFMGDDFEVDQITGDAEVSDISSLCNDTKSTRDSSSLSAHRKVLEKSSILGKRLFVDDSD